MAVAVGLPPALGIDAPHLGILLGHPSRLGPGGGGEERVEAARGEPVHDAIEPSELEAALLGLEVAPGEDADREGVATRLLHEAEVLLDDRRLVEPLVGVPVPAVQDVRKAGDDRGVAIRRRGESGARPGGRGAEQAAGKGQPGGGAQRSLEEVATREFGGARRRWAQGLTSTRAVGWCRRTSRHAGASLCAAGRRLDSSGASSAREPVDPPPGLPNAGATLPPLLPVPIGQGTGATCYTRRRIPDHRAMVRSLRRSAVVIGISATALAAAAPEPPAYKDPRIPVERRVSDLLARMTLEEKAAQTLALWRQKDRITSDDGRFDPGRGGPTLSHGIGPLPP